MKKIIFAVLIAYSIQTGYAQDSIRSISKGTWVVESNIRTPRDQVVKFYNSKLELIYQESVTNKKIRYEKERVKKALNKTLEIALQNNDTIEPGAFVSVLKNKKP